MDTSEVRTSVWERQMIDAKREEYGAGSSRSYGSDSRNTGVHHEPYSRSRSYNEGERDSRGESMDESGSDGFMEEDDVDELKQEVRGLLKDLSNPIKGKSLRPYGSYVNFFLDYRYCSCPNNEICMKCNHQIKHRTYSGISMDQDDKEDADYIVEEDKHYKAVSDGEFTADDGDTADDDTADEEMEDEEGQELEVEVNQLIEQQKEPVNGKSLEKHRGQLHYKYCVCDDRVERKRTKSQQNNKNRLCLKCNHEILPKEDLLGSCSGCHGDKDSSSENSEESEDDGALSDTDFETEVKLMFHGIKDPANPQVHFHDIFEGMDYIVKDKEEYEKEEDRDYILQEDHHFKEKDSDVSSSAESDSGSEDDVDVAELEIEVMKLFNDLDKPIQDIFEGVDYISEDKDGDKNEDDQDYVVEEDPDFGRGSSGVSSAADSDSCSEEEMDDDEVRSEIKELFYDLEEPINGKSFIVRHYKDSEHPEVKKKYRYCGCSEPMSEEQDRSETGESVICHECRHEKVDGITISVDDDTDDSADEENEDAVPSDVCEAASFDAAESPVISFDEEGPIVGLEDYKEEEDEDYIVDSGEETADDETADDETADDETVEDDTADGGSLDDSSGEYSSDSDLECSK